MVSIPQTYEPVQAQEQLTTYRYVFRLTPERIRTLTPEQKEQALLEFLTLFNLILSVIYNPVAKEATRLLALDVIVTQVQRSARKLIGTITDKSPTHLETVGKRLGFHKNTVSSGYAALEKSGCLDRSYRDGEKPDQHLDIQPALTLYTAPDVIRDKKKRAAPKPKLGKPVDITKQCLECDSKNIRVVCRDCGSFIDLREGEHTCEVEADTAEEREPHHKFCDDTKEPKPGTNFVTVKKPPTPPLEAIACSTLAPAILPRQAMKERPQPAEQPETERQLEQAARLLLDIAGDTQEHIVMNTNPHNPKKYLTVHRPLTLEDMRGHLKGTKTVGALLTHNDGTTRALCFDGDDDRSWQTMTASAQLLIAKGLSPLLEPSPAGRGWHLWIIFTDRINAQAAYREVCTIAPRLQECGEYWPNTRNQKVRLPAGKYVTPAFSAWTHLYDAFGDELPTSALLTHQTPAELIPASDTAEPKPDISREYPRNRDKRSVTKSTEHGGVDEYHRQKYGQHAMWVEWPSEQYLIDRFNEQHTIDELATCERNGMINASTIGRPERTASVGITKDGQRFTDFGAGARKGDGSQDGGDAFEFYIRSHQLNKSDVLRELGVARSREASQELLRSARAGELPPAWVMDIITDKGRTVYNQNAVRHGHNILEAHSRGVVGFSEAGGQEKQESCLAWQAEQEDREQGIPEDFTMDTPCEQCGCCLYRDMLGSMVCVRCYPPRGYHNYSDLIDDQYPRLKRVEFRQ